MKLYEVIRNYGKIKILDMIWANDEEEVYIIESWTKEDKPPLEIREIEIKKGCFLSRSVK